MANQMCVIQILSGKGQLPENFAEKWHGRNIFGLEAAVKLIGKGPLPVGPPIGIVITMPYETLVNIGSHDISEFMGDLRQYFEMNDNQCNFSLQGLITEMAMPSEVNVTYKDLAADNIDDFFKCLKSEAGAYIRRLDPPGDSRWATYINMDPTIGMVRDATAFDIRSKDFYILDLEKGGWVLQPKPDGMPV